MWFESLTSANNQVIWLYNVCPIHLKKLYEIFCFPFYNVYYAGQWMQSTQTGVDIFTPTGPFFVWEQDTLPQRWLKSCFGLFWTCGTWPESSNAVFWNSQCIFKRHVCCCKSSLNEQRDSSLFWYVLDQAHQRSYLYVLLLPHSFCGLLLVVVIHRELNIYIKSVKN